MKTGETERRDHQVHLRRGALFNLLGGLAKLMQPAFLLAITWLWGPAVTGLYLLGQSLTDIVSGGLASGYADATTVFASRHVDGAEHDEAAGRALYRVLANTFAVSAGASLAVCGLALLFAHALIAAWFPDYQALLPGLLFFAASLVPRAISAIAIAGTKAVMHMEHDALLNGVLHPISCLLGLLIAYGLGGGISSLCAVQLAVDLLVCAFSLRAFSRYFSGRRLLDAVRAFSFDRELLGFAVPQSLNLTFNRYITRIDAIMLASFGLSQSDLGYFGTAAFLTSNLGQIRTIFSGAVAPLIVRHHARGDRELLQQSLGQIAGWTTSLIAPVVLVLLVLRRDVLELVSPAYGHDSLFVAVLLIPPFTNCAYGMAGACLMFTGHTRVTLMNSFCMALLNTGFAYLLIPTHGMLGAAIGTALATSIMTGLQMLELSKLELIRIPWSAVWKPHLGFALGLLVLAWYWDPVLLPILGRMILAGCLALGFFLLMRVLGREGPNGSQSSSAGARLHDHS